MRVLKGVLIVLVVLVLLIVGVGFLLPRNVHVERTTTIEAPPATVFALLNGFKRFNEWSPWAAQDPNARYTYTGPAFGVGAAMAWQGDPDTVGQGSQTIVESRPHELVRTKLDFGAQGQAMASLTLSREGTGTRVVWGFDSDLGNNPLARYFGLVFDRYVGRDYEKGLAQLRTLAEGLPDADFADLAVEHVTVTAVPVAYVEATSTTDEQAIATSIGTAYRKVGAFMSKHRLQQAAAPITINTAWSDAGYRFDAAIPIDRRPEKPIPADSPVQLKDTYAGPALKVVHRGPYRQMPATYDKLFAWVAAHGYEQAGPPWDEYVSDPGSTPESDLITHVYLPVR